MPTLSLCFEIHQPYRLRPFSFFDIGRSTEYFDVLRNKSFVEQACSQAYTSAHAALDRIFKKWGSSFQCALLLSGTAIEQIRDYAPGALTEFCRLSERSEIELLGGTYYHSLASLAPNLAEFSVQVELHRQLLQSEFGVSPAVFCDSARVFSNQIAESVKNLGFSGIIASDLIDATSGSPACRVYSAPTAGIRILTCNQEISNNVRILEKHVPEQLPPERMARRLQEIASGEDVVSLVMDYAVCGTSPGEVSSEQSFIECLADIVLHTPGWRFLTPSRALQEAVAPGLLSYPHERAVAAMSSRSNPLLGNSLQQKAFIELYDGLFATKADPHVWRKLQSIDHFRGMSTLVTDSTYSSRQHSPFESPYDVFIGYMNVLRALGHEDSLSRKRSSPG